MHFFCLCTGFFNSPVDFMSVRALIAPAEIKCQVSSICFDAEMTKRRQEDKKKKKEERSGGRKGRRESLKARSSVKDRNGISSLTSPQCGPMRRRRIEANL